MEQAESKARVRLRIEGRVQGVFFRASTVEEAAQLRLKGWVKNSPDGSVEVLAEGRQGNIDAFVQWCHQGPPGAHVRGVTVRREDYRGEFQDFRITR